MSVINLIKSLFSTRPLNFFERVGHQKLAPILSIPLLFMLFGGWVVSSFATLVLFLFGGYVYSRYSDALKARAAALDGPEWKVEANQVVVGRISDAKYAEIVFTVLTDWRVYWLQTKNLLRVACKLVDFIFESAPKLIFWVLAAFAFFAPEAIVGLIAAIPHATPVEIEQSIRTAGTLVLTVVFLAATVTKFSGPYRFGFCDEFNEAIREKLRLHFSLLADASFVLFRESPVETIVLHEIPSLQRDRVLDEKIGKRASSIPADGNADAK